MPRISKRTWLLGTIFLVLFFAISLEFKNLQNVLDFPHLPANDMSLTERDKSYLDRYTDLTKWLIGLSYALLVAVASKRFSSRDEAMFRSAPFSLGVGLLILSLYGGFLSYQSILIVLSSKPTWMLRSQLTSFPVAVQLWLLSASTALLAFAFFRRADNPGSPSRDSDDQHSSSPSFSTVKPQ